MKFQRKQKCKQAAPQECFICNTKTRFYTKNKTKILSIYSKTNVSELIQRLLGDIETKNELIAKSQFICDECLLKINEYDQACVTAERIAGELRQMLLQEDPNEKLITSEVLLEEKTITNELKDVLDVNLSDCIKTEIASEIGMQINLEDGATVSTHTENTFKEGGEVITNNVATNKRKHECQICLITFERKTDLKKHSAEHKIEVNKFQCNICNFNPKEQIALDEHKKMHVGLSPLQCVICRKVFHHKRNIKPHMRLHTGQKKYQCDRCGKEYFHKSSFSLHMSYHNGTRNESCPHCSMQFITKTDLEKHIRTHTGEKPYPCEICGKRFARSDNMREHRKIHDKQQIDKPYHCSFCDSTFVRRSKLNKHMEKHGVMTIQKEKKN